MYYVKATQIDFCDYIRAENPLKQAEGYIVLTYHLIKLLWL